MNPTFLNRHVSLSMWNITQQQTLFWLIAYRTKNDYAKWKIKVISDDFVVNTEALILVWQALYPVLQSPVDWWSDPVVAGPKMFKNLHILASLFYAFMGHVVKCELLMFRPQVWPLTQFHSIKKQRTCFSYQSTILKMEKSCQVTILGKKTQPDRADSEGLCSNCVELWRSNSNWHTSLGSANDGIGNRSDFWCRRKLGGGNSQPEATLFQ